ncbi:MAG: hypothetical protein K2Q20_08530, partial [Phycisphaerales bacterium]|nr:hypothetical protein [Phycisphaerales bacterium]
IVVAAIGTAVALPLLMVQRERARREKDADQVRSLVQGIVVWCSSCNSEYPIPSRLGLGNATVPERGEEQDTTGNVLSLLIFNGVYRPEDLISPSESNTAQVQVDTDYQYTQPWSAVNPDAALWDPAFRGTPIDRPRLGAPIGISNNSYAHLVFTGQRAKFWSDTYSSTETIFANRGPTYAPDDAGPSRTEWILPPGPTGAGSNTLLFHARSGPWRGHIGYNDGHVKLETSPTPSAVTFRSAGSTSAPDNVFVDETDEVNSAPSNPRDMNNNMYLRPIADRSQGLTVWRD